MSASASDSDPHEHGAHKPKPRLSQTEASALVAMWNSLQMDGGHAQPAKPEVLKYVVASVATMGLIITIWTAAGNVVESNKGVAATNQKLIDHVDSIDTRVALIEKGRAENLPRIDGEIAKAASENKMQNDRIQNAAEALSDERRARNDDNAATRKAQADILALIARLTEKVADLDKGQALLQDRQQRSNHSEIDRPQHDAQAVGGPAQR